MNTTYGKNISLSIFGQSHSKEIGMTLSGIPMGLPVDMDNLQQFLDRRAPGKTETSTSRKENDIPRFLSGIKNNTTDSDPITAIIYNQDIRKSDYDKIAHLPRPGHADYTARIKYGTDRNLSGGGQFSGRMTAPICIAGGLCLQWLETQGIHIKAHIDSIGKVRDLPLRLDPIEPNLCSISEEFPVLNKDAGKLMQQAILAAKQDGDSLGGVIECIITGLPAGIGGPLFDGIEGRIAHLIYAIPAVKGIEFGSGFSGSEVHGSENNDAFIISNGQIITKTNHCGGILGGISTGMPIQFRVAIKPTPSIAKEQQTVNLETMTESSISVAGRHDPCIVPRAVPVIEAAAAIVIYDMLMDK